ncbi:MAG: TlpA disulfide reductase family protein [Desulfovibrionaceae bacterium]
MRRQFYAVLVLVLALLATAGPASANALFPDFPLSAQLTTEQQAYLGVTGPTLRLSEVQAPLLLIEVFSMYCPYCQRDAPEVNEFHKRLRLQGLDSKLKILGIGAGNTPFEVDFFKDKFAVPFPLFADEDYAVHTALGNVGTPYFVLVRVTGPDKLEILLTQEGSPENMQAFFTDVLKKAGLE